MLGLNFVNFGPLNNFPKTLTVINNTQKLVRKKIKDFDIEKINYEDQKVFDLMSTDGKTDILVFRYNSAVWQEVGRTLNLSES